MQFSGVTCKSAQVLELWHKDIGPAYLWKFKTSGQWAVNVALACVVNLMDFKIFAVASTTFQDVPNTALEKMILLGSAFILDLHIPWKVFNIGLNKRLKADRLRIILQTTRRCEMDINPSLLYQKLFRWHCKFQIKSIRGWLHVGNSNS